MSYENYIKSQEVAQLPFEAIIMGFMRVADSSNLAYLQMKYPDIWDELQTRYNAPGGLLESENIGTSKADVPRETLQNIASQIDDINS